MKIVPIKGTHTVAKNMKQKTTELFMMTQFVFFSLSRGNDVLNLVSSIRAQQKNSYAVQLTKITYSIYIYNRLHSLVLS